MFSYGRGTPVVNRAGLHGLLANKETHRPQVGPMDLGLALLYGPRGMRVLIKNRGTSLISNNPLLGPYSRTIPRILLWS